jgi:hypothetical protein
MIPGVAYLVSGIMVTITPVEWWFQIGLAALLSGISQTLVGFILFKLMALFAKMIPLKQ